MKTSQTHQYQTSGGVTVTRASISADYREATGELLRELDTCPGVLLSSAYEYPGRYARWDLGCVHPPLRLVARGRDCEITALNARGKVLLQMFRPVLAGSQDLASIEELPDALHLRILPAEPVILEELRTRQRSVFSMLRNLIAHFSSNEDPHLGFFGAFGYELAFQFEAVALKQARTENHRDLVLYMPDTILVVDHRREQARMHYYDFEQVVEGQVYSTRHLPRQTSRHAFSPGQSVESTGDEAPVQCDHAPGEYAATVRKALGYFQRGDLFEAVPGQTFHTPCQDLPSRIFTRLQSQNPAPYGAMLNLGDQEYLVAASPEMFVRVEGRRVETCPISGTIARGKDALEDAQQIRNLLNSRKDEAELSMCTDVDRNDKARVCVPGSIKVIGRRQLELYSRLIHTVDHVEGELKAGMDGLDAFLSHAWAVTVTGAPKQAAIQFIEDHELTPRRWYGGAIGCLHFNGDINTGLTIRTIHIEAGQARVRSGATLLADSDPLAEEVETRLKTSALLAALKPLQGTAPISPISRAGAQPGKDRRILMVDHQDSFVHTLASYLQESGAQVRTVRPASVAAQLSGFKPDLVVLSPGPGRPADFGVAQTLASCEALGIPVFGVCLGLQAMVEYCGGSLGNLLIPMHGKASVLTRFHGPLFKGIEGEIQVGRYHSLVAQQIPDCLEVVATTEDGCVMAIQHRSLPFAAVQFHPESILSLGADCGRRILHNMLRFLLPARSADGTQIMEKVL